MSKDLNLLGEAPFSLDTLLLDLAEAVVLPVVPALSLGLVGAPSEAGLSFPDQNRTPSA